MPAVMIVWRDMKTACASLQASRQTVLLVAVDTLIYGGRLTVTDIGRAVCSKTMVTQVDQADGSRLLRNGQMQGEREPIQAALIHWVLGVQIQAVIVVDYSDRTADRRWQLVRASLPVGERALTWYE